MNTAVSARAPNNRAKPAANIPSGLKGAEGAGAGVTARTAAVFDDLTSADDVSSRAATGRGLSSLRTAGVDEVTETRSGLVAATPVSLGRSVIAGAAVRTNAVDGSGAVAGGVAPVSDPAIVAGSRSWVWRGVAVVGTGAGGAGGVGVASTGGVSDETRGDSAGWERVMIIGALVAFVTAGGALVTATTGGGGGGGGEC